LNRRSLLILPLGRGGVEGKKTAFSKSCGGDRRRYEELLEPFKTVVVKKVRASSRRVGIRPGDEVLSEDKNIKFSESEHALKSYWSRKKGEYSVSRKKESWSTNKARGWLLRKASAR